MTKRFSFSGVISTVLVFTPAKLGTNTCLQNGAYLEGEGERCGARRGFEKPTKPEGGWCCFWKVEKGACLHILVFHTSYHAWLTTPPKRSPFAPKHLVRRRLPLPGRQSVRCRVQDELKVLRDRYQHEGDDTKAHPSTSFPPAARKISFTWAPKEWGCEIGMQSKTREGGGRSAPSSRQTCIKTRKKCRANGANKYLHHEKARVGNSTLFRLNVHTP